MRQVARLLSTTQVRVDDGCAREGTDHSAPLGEYELGSIHTRISNSAPFVRCFGHVARGDVALLTVRFTCAMRTRVG